MHPATDNLCGTHVYGTPGESVSWSVNFEEAVPNWNEFLFASGDCSLWIVMTKCEAIGCDGMRTYSNTQLRVQVRKIDTKLAQKLGQLQPFRAVLQLYCMGQLAYFGPT
jgi:hypothetical protein